MILYITDVYLCIMIMVCVLGFCVVIYALLSFP